MLKIGVKNINKTLSKPTSKNCERKNLGNKLGISLFKNQFFFTTYYTVVVKIMLKDDILVQDDLVLRHGGVKVVPARCVCSLVISQIHESTRSANTVVLVEVRHFYQR